jgi:hypothetical protein
MYFGILFGNKLKNFDELFLKNKKWAKMYPVKYVYIVQCVWKWLFPGRPLKNGVSRGANEQCWYVNSACVFEYTRISYRGGGGVWHVVLPHPFGQHCCVDTQSTSLVHGVPVHATDATSTRHAFVLTTCNIYSLQQIVVVFCFYFFMQINAGVGRRTPYLSL